VPGTHMVVGRVRKAFGLKGELLVHPVTTEPDAVFASGRVVFARSVAPGAARTHDLQPHVIQRSRPFKDAWLVKVEHVDDRNAADLWRGVELSAPDAELRAPAENELYLHELVGMQVREASLGALGAVESWYPLPQGLVLEVRGPEWRADIPFNEAFVREVDRAARTIVVALPEGLAERTVNAKPER